jgi:hypothetical protein
VCCGLTNIATSPIVCLSLISRGFYINYILCKQNNLDDRVVIHKPGITYVILDIFV